MDEIEPQHYYNKQLTSILNSRFVFVSRFLFVVNFDVAEQAWRAGNSSKTSGFFFFFSLHSCFRWLYIAHKNVLGKARM